MTSTVVKTGITIEYEVLGEGEPLLLVMGLGAQMVAWSDPFVFGLVDRGFQVIRFDNRDIGLSSKIDAPPPSVGRAFAGIIMRRFARSAYLLGDMADDAAGLLDVLGVERAHVVGASMGGMISQELAIRHPQRVASLTSIMSTTGSRRVGQPKLNLLAKLSRTVDGGRDTYVERDIVTGRLISGSLFDASEARVLAERALARNFCPEGVLRQTAAIAASPDRTRALGKLTVPTLVVHGLEDPLVQPSGGVATTRAIPGARLLAFPDMGHNLPTARLGEVHDAIVETASRAGFRGRATSTI